MDPETKRQLAEAHELSLHRRGRRVRGSEGPSLRTKRSSLRLRQHDKGKRKGAGRRIEHGIVGLAKLESEFAVLVQVAVRGASGQMMPASRVVAGSPVLQADSIHIAMGVREAQAGPRPRSPGSRLS